MDLTMLVSCCLHARYVLSVLTSLSCELLTGNVLNGMFCLTLAFIK